MLRFNLNGAWVEVRHVAPTLTLLRWLRDHRALTGTKEGCAEGDCGACTVAVAETSPEGRCRWRAVNSCLLLLPMLQGKHVVTIEGLQRGGLHPAQAAIVSALGSQCGYCTPGVVMSLFEATYRMDLDEPWKVDDQLAGNLCRCTGYRPIHQAARAVAGTTPDDDFSRALQEPPGAMALDYHHGPQRFITPQSLEGLWSALALPQARVVAGGTDLGLEVTKRFAAPPLLVSLEGLPALRTLTHTPAGSRLGATATISELEDFSSLHLPSLHRMLRYFGARQVKHRATVGGNLMTASPIGDLAPVLLSLGAVAVVASEAGERRVPLDAFFVAYRKTDVRPGEILAAVEVPTPNPRAYTCAYKVSKRRELDISTVSAGFCVEVDQGRVTAARLAYGGMAATPKRASRTEQALVGREWTASTIERVVSELWKDFTPLSDHRGSSEYRSQVAANLLLGFFEELSHGDYHPRLEAGHAATVQP